MKKILLILSLLILVGCGDLGEDDLSASWYKGITNAKVPGACLDSQDDVCALFDCMVDLCWCKESPDQILYETHIPFDDEQGAIDAVNVYLAELINGGLETEIENPENLKVIKAVKLNDIFYNVFADNNGDEEVYTVAADGTIIKTICGV